MIGTKLWGDDLKLLMQLEEVLDHAGADIFIEAQGVLIESVYESCQHNAPQDLKASGGDKAISEFCQQVVVPRLEKWATSMSSNKFQQIVNKNSRILLGDLLNGGYTATNPDAIEDHSGDLGKEIRDILSIRLTAGSDQCSFLLDVSKRNYSLVKAYGLL